MTNRFNQITRFGLLGVPGILIRFGISGALNGLVYAGVFALATYSLNCTPFISSGLGYLSGLCIGFVLHRQFTFFASGNIYGQLLRYFVAQAVTMAAVMCVSALTARFLSWPTWLVILSGIILAPGLNFTFMHLWVFTRAPNR